MLGDWIGTSVLLFFLWGGREMVTWFRFLFFVGCNKTFFHAFIHTNHTSFPLNI